MKSIIDRIFSIKALLSLLLVFAASGAWAAVKPLAVWNGDFPTTNDGTDTRGGYTLSMNGNTASADGSIVTISSSATRGVTVMRATSTTPSAVVVGVSDIPSTKTKTVFLSRRTDSYDDIDHLALDTSKKIKFIMDNHNDKHNSNKIFGDGVHYVGISYNTSLSPGTSYYYDKTLLGAINWQWSARKMFGYTLGGCYNSASGHFDTYNADGAKFNYVAVIESSAATDIQNWSPTNMTSACSPATGTTLSATENDTLETQGINLPVGGYITISGDVKVAALFAQGNSGIHFADENSSLTVSGPVYVADSNRLTITPAALTTTDTAKTLISASVIGSDSNVSVTVPEESGYRYVSSVGDTAVTLIRYKDIGLDYTATPDGGFYAGSAWFTDFGGYSTPEAYRVGPSTTYPAVSEVKTSEFNPYKNYTAALPFSFAIYADLSEMAENTIIMEFGTQNNGIIMYKNGDGGGNVRVGRATNGNISGVVQVVRPNSGKGYHLYTVTCAADGSLNLYVDDGTVKGSGTIATDALAAGFQIGSIYGGGTISWLSAGNKMAVAKILGWNGVLSAEDVAALAQEYPATTGTIDRTILWNNSGNTLKVYSSEEDSTACNIDVDAGAVTIVSGEEVSVSKLRTQPSGIVGEIGASSVTVAGTLNINGSDSTIGSKAEDASICLGYWVRPNQSGARTTDLTVASGGVLNAPNAYVQIPWATHCQGAEFNISGTAKIKGLYSNQSGKGTVTLANGGVLEVAEILSSGQAITKNFRYGTFRIAADAEETRAINFSAVSSYATTLDPNGHTLTMAAAAMTGSAAVTIGGSNGGKVVFKGWTSSFTGTLQLTDANSHMIEVQSWTDFVGNITGTLTIDDTNKDSLSLATFPWDRFSGNINYAVTGGTLDLRGYDKSSNTINVTGSGATVLLTAGQEGTLNVSSGATAELYTDADTYYYLGHVYGSGMVEGTLVYKFTADSGVTYSAVAADAYNGNNLLPYYYVWETTEGSSAGIASGETSGWGRMDGGTRPVNGKNVAFHVQGETTVNVDEANVSYATVQAYGSGTLRFSGANALTVATQFVVADGVTLEYDTTKLTVSSLEVDDGAELVVGGGTEVSPIAITADIAGEGTLRIASGAVSLNHVNRNFTGDIYIMPGARAVSTVATDNTATGFGRQGTTITVYVGGQLDVAGTSGVSHNLVIDTDPAGGEGDYEAAIVNTGTNIGNTEHQACSLTVNTSATIDCSHTWGILASSHGATTLTLAKGVTLTKTGTGTFLIASATVSNTGSGVTNPGIDIAEGTVEIVSQGSSTACTLATGATLDVVVENGATLNVYKGFAASNLVVSGNGTVNVSSSGSLTLSAAYGAGTVNWTGKSPDGDVWKTSAGWTGTNVVISATGLTDMNPANWGNASSFIKLNGVAGHFVQGNVEATAKKTILEDNGADAALQISNGYQGSSVTFRKIVGDGTIADTHNHTTAWHMLVFKDATEFTGSIKATQASGCKKFVFSDAGTGTASASGSEGRLVVQSDGHAVIGAGKEWKPAYSIHIAGEVKLLGAATMSKPVTINGTTAKLLLADTALTINNTLTFADGAKLTIDPGDIDLTTTATLITGLTNTEAPVISGITVPGCTVSVGGASGAYTIDAVYKDTSWRGESATWSESSFNGKASATDGQDVMFMAGASGAVTVTLDGTRTPANVVFNGGSTTTYTLTGGTFSPSGTVTVESGSVTIESAATGTYVVNAGATLSLTNATVTSVSGSGTLNIPEGGVITLASATAIDGIASLTGRGKLVMPAGTFPGSALQALLKNANWQGIVAVSSLTDNAQRDLNDWGNEGSKVELKAVKGYLNINTTISPEVVLRNDTGDAAYAFSFGNGWSYTSANNKTFVRKISGDGKLTDFAGGNSNTYPSQLYLIRNARDWTGSIANTGRFLLFSESAAAPSPDDDNTKGTVQVAADGYAVLGDGSSWQSNNGIKIAGTVEVLGTATLSSNVTCLDNAVIKFDAIESGSCALSLSASVTVAANATVNIAFGDGVTPVAGTKLISWGGAPAGTFAFDDGDGGATDHFTQSGTDYVLSSESDGLYLRAAVATATTAGSVTSYHNTLAGAVTAAGAAGTVTLLASATGDVVLPAGAVLRLNGNTLTGSVTTASGYVVGLKNSVYTSYDASSTNETWTDDGGDHAWSNSANWNLGFVPVATTGITFNDGAVPVISANVNFAGMTVNGTATISGSGDVQVGGSVTAGDNAKLVLSGVCLKNTSGSALTIAMPVDLNNAALADSMTISGAVAISGTFHSWGAAQTFSGAVSIASGADIKINENNLTVSGTTTFNGNFTKSANTTENKALILGAVTVAENTVLTVSQGSVTFGGVATVQSGKTLTIHASGVTVSGSFVLGAATAKLVDNGNSASGKVNTTVANSVVVATTATGVTTYEVAAITEPVAESTTIDAAGIDGKIAIPINVTVVEHLAPADADRLVLKVEYTPEGGSATTGYYTNILTVDGSGNVSLIDNTSATALVNGAAIKVKPEVAESSPMTLGGTTPGFTVKTIPGLYYTVEKYNASTEEYESAGDASLATTTTTTIGADNEAWGEGENVRYYRIKVSTTGN